MKNFIRKISFRMVLWSILVIYTLMWSYWYLAIQYAEHRQATVSRAFQNCVDNELPEEVKEYCFQVYSEFSVKTFFFFTPVLQEKKD